METLGIYIIGAFFIALFFAPVWCKPLDRLMENLGGYLPVWLIFIIWYGIVCLILWIVVNALRAALS